MVSKHTSETKDERRLRKQKKKEIKERKKRSRDESLEKVSSNDNVERAKKIKAEPIESTPQIITSKPKGDAEDSTESPFHWKTIHCLVSLQPSALSNLPKSLNQSMRNLLLRYYSSFGGVILSFENLEIISKTDNGLTCGLVWNELPHMNFSVKVDALLFRPDVGMKLTGSINESFPSHVGILVHSFFNAVVHADDLREAGYIFDIELNEWKKDKSGFSDSLEVGLDIEFTVEKVHEVNGDFSLEGSKPTIVFEDNTD